MKENKKTFCKIMISLPKEIWIEAKKKSLDEERTLSGLICDLLCKYLISTKIKMEEENVNTDGFL